MAATMEKLSLNRVMHFNLFASAQLTRFVSLGPAGGFRDAAAPHFLKVSD
jgi:hypothetical protein